MSGLDDNTFDYSISAQAFNARAAAACDAFDRDSKPEDLLRAVLELRYGIEARLYEYISGSLSTLKQKPKRIKEYTATRLLALLTGLDPNAKRRATIRITGEQSGRSGVLHYTPVTHELAVIHGKLGGLLHYSYFENNRTWFIKDRLGPDAPTLLDARDLVRKGIAELQQATAGHLLAPPSFTEVVAKLNVGDVDQSLSSSGEDG